MLVMNTVELAKKVKKISVGVVNHEVECELLKHGLFVRENAVSPSPVLLALLIDDELGVLLSDLGDGNDDVLRLLAILFDLVG